MAHPIRPVIDLEPHCRGHRGESAALPAGWLPVAWLPAGLWRVDPARSRVGFAGRYLGAVTIRGRFAGFSADLIVAEPFTASAAALNIDAATICTGVPLWDQQLRSGGFLDAAQFPTITFRSTALAVGRAGWRVTGELTVREITRPLIVEVVVGSVVHDRASGTTRAELRARAMVDRTRFGLSAHAALPDDAAPRRDTVALEVALCAELQDRDVRPCAA